MHACRTHSVNLSCGKNGSLQLNLEQFMLEDYEYDDFIPDTISMILIDDNNKRCAWVLSDAIYDWRQRKLEKTGNNSTDGGYWKGSFRT